RTSALSARRRLEHPVAVLVLEEPLEALHSLGAGLNELTVLEFEEVRLDQFRLRATGAGRRLIFVIEVAVSGALPERQVHRLGLPTTDDPQGGLFTSLEILDELLEILDLTAFDLAVADPDNHVVLLDAGGIRRGVPDDI